MQTYLKGLTALHSADMQASDSHALGRPVRRDPVTTEHPLIRTNPVTGWNSLFFNPGFVTKIVGIPKTESDAIIRYLTEVIATTQEMHARFQWNKNDVAIWDNRTTVSIMSFTVHLSFKLIVDRTTLLLMDSLLTVAMLCASAATQSAPSWIRQENRKKRNSSLFTTCRLLTRMVPGSLITMTDLPRLWQII